MVSLAEKPLTGEPDAGNPPVRFGGRGDVPTAIPTPIPADAGLRDLAARVRRGEAFGLRCFSTALEFGHFSLDSGRPLG